MSNRKVNKNGQRTNAVKDVAEKSLRVKVGAESACMSAPGKNNTVHPEMQYLTFKSSDAASTHDGWAAAMEKDAPSRFSSCTAKTSPSTDNNSNGNVTENVWDVDLQAKICQQSALETSGEPNTPSRMRACSDTTPSGSFAESPSTTCS